MRLSAIFSGAVFSLLCAMPAGLLAVQSSGGQTASTAQWAAEGATAWDYVGSIGQASGVYLGSYGDEHWVLSAAHVGVGTFRLGGHTYSAVSGSGVTIDAVNGNPNQPDLILFRITTADLNAQNYLDSLTVLKLMDVPLAITSDVRLVGHGDNNGSAVIKSWGDNSIAGRGLYSITNTNYGGTGYYTLDAGGVRAVTGDSGGGMFYWTGDAWALAGIMSAAGTIGDLGGGMLAVALDVYVDQILAAVPEPAAFAALVALLALGGVLVARRRGIV